jgi:hypothetical protein
MKRILLFFFLIALISEAVILTTGCANIVPPQGGPRDTIPPVLLKANPGDSSRNFTGNRITFTFDEFVDVQSVQNNLLVSPTPRNTPAVDFKLNTVTIRLKDSLETNTTYSLNFGDAIKDYNEGNVLKEFTYIFSTGAYIDSLELSGKVILAEDGKTDSSLIVMLHNKSDDSVIIKEKPRYIAKLDGKGNFQFKNLPPGTFYLYALKDEGGSRRYFDNKQLFAFADSPVITSQKNNPVTLYAFAEKKEAAQQAPVLTTRRGVTKEGGDNRLRVQTNLANNLLDLQQDLIISFELPLRSFDSSKISLAIDSAYTPATGYTFIKDSTGKKLQLKYNWTENTAYHLLLEKDFAEDTTGRKLLKTDTLSFNTRKKEDYGTLSIRLRNLDLSKNPVLLFIQGTDIKKMFPLSSADFSQSLFVPGEYQLSILNDDNKNGKWDPGEFFGKHKQPEIVKPIERKINVKAGLDNEFEIAL